MTCRILICFTMVLFPDSPAPGREGRGRAVTRGPGCGRAASPTSAGIRGSRRARPGPGLGRLSAPAAPPALPCPAPPPYPAEASGASLCKPAAPSAIASLFFCWLLAALSHRYADPPFCCCPDTPSPPLGRDVRLLPARTGVLQGKRGGGRRGAGLNPDISAALSLRFFPPLCSNKMVSSRALIKTEFVCFPPREGCEGPRWPRRAGRGGGRDPRSNA